MFVFCLFGSLTEPLPRKLRFSFLTSCFGLFPTEELFSLWPSSFQSLALFFSVVGPLLFSRWPFSFQLLALFFSAVGPFLFSCWPFSFQSLALFFSVVGPFLFSRWPFSFQLLALFFSVVGPLFSALCFVAMPPPRLRPGA